MSKGPKSEEAKEREMKIAALAAAFFAVRLFRNDHGRWQPPITGQNRDVLECAVEDTRNQLAEDSARDASALLAAIERVA